jgi:hypothetical protein
MFRRDRAVQRIGNVREATTGRPRFQIGSDLGLGVHTVQISRLGQALTTWQPQTQKLLGNGTQRKTVSVSLINSLEVLTFWLGGCVMKVTVIEVCSSVGHVGRAAHVVQDVASTKQWPDICM